MVNLVYCYQGQGDMPHAVCLKVKSVGKPDAVAPHVRFDEREWETGHHATAQGRGQSLAWDRPLSSDNRVAAEGLISSLKSPSGYLHALLPLAY
jgi:hypothetical protein